MVPTIATRPLYSNPDGKKRGRIRLVFRHAQGLPGAFADHDILAAHRDLSLGDQFHHQRVEPMLGLQDAG